MGKLGTLSKIAASLASNPKRLLNVLDPEAGARSYLLDTYPEFANGLPCCDIVDVIPEFRETVSPYTFLDGTSSVLDLALLKSLARRFDRCRYLEVGTWRGESVANVADVASECITIDLPDDELASVRGVSEDVRRQVGFFSEPLENVRQVRGDSRMLDFSAFGEVDLVFLDGDHRREAVRDDTAKAFASRRDERSVIVWHDYVFATGEVRAEVLAGILDGTPADERKHLRGVAPTWCAVWSPSLDALPVFPQDALPVPRLSFDVGIVAKRI